MKYFAVILSVLISVLTFNGLYAQDEGYAEKASDVRPLLIGSKAPDTSVRNIEGDEISLRSILSEKPSVLIFYRGGWCPYCSQHLADLNEIEGDLKDLGYQILAVSADRPEELKKSMNKSELAYTLLSDSPMTTTKAFGLAFRVDDETVSNYLNYGIDLEKSSGYDHHLLPVPAVYFFDTDGNVLFNYVNPDYRERINGEILLTAAKVYAKE